MKRMIMTLVAVWMMITSMNAQRLTNIQAEARFITDRSSRFGPCHWSCRG